MRFISLTLIAATALAAPAAAAITTANFHGYGVVTGARVGDNPEDVQPTPPLVGTPVKVTGLLYFGDYAPPDDFTGKFVFDEYELQFGLGQGYRWSVAGGKSSASTFLGGTAYAFGNADFVDGRLTGVDIYVDFDGEDHHLFGGGWDTNYSYSDVDWRGTWTLSVPEPSSWALLLAGFALTGLALRRRVPLAG